jgi:hypothetical protein
MIDRTNSGLWMSLSSCGCPRRLRVLARTRRGEQRADDDAADFADCHTALTFEELDDERMTDESNGINICTISKGVVSLPFERPSLDVEEIFLTLLSEAEVIG